MTPERFTDPAIVQQLDVVTKIPGLYMTGQDTVLCGVTLCQVSSKVFTVAMTLIIAEAIFKILISNIHLLVVNDPC